MRAAKVCALRAQLSRDGPSCKDAVTTAIAAGRLQMRQRSAAQRMPAHDAVEEAPSGQSASARCRAPTARAAPHSTQCCLLSASAEWQSSHRRSGSPSRAVVHHPYSTVRSSVLINSRWAGPSDNHYASYFMGRIVLPTPAPSGEHLHSDPRALLRPHSQGLRYLAARNVVLEAILA